jgi:hypothetical protein
MLFSPCTPIRSASASARRLRGKESSSSSLHSAPICSFEIAGDVCPDLSQHSTSR